jgi:hypothetical protein
MLDEHRKSISNLRDKHISFIDAFLRRRCAEETDLDFAKLKRSCLGYVEWVAAVVTAARANLARRKWSSILGVVDEMAATSLTDATKNPVKGERRVPTLLADAFFINDYLDRLNNRQSPLVSIDLNPDLQTGVVLLGQAEAQSIDESAKAAATLAAMMLGMDLRAAGEQSLRVPPETVPTLQELLVGGRRISDRERTLVGRWTYQEYHSSGGFSARFDLHMILLANGTCVRTSKAIASSTFRDSSGNWAGFMDSASDLAPGDRGKWTYDGILLTLTMDDGSVYEYRVTSSSGKSMMTKNPTSGEQRFWTRG